MDPIQEYLQGLQNRVNIEDSKKYVKFYDTELKGHIEKFIIDNSLIVIDNFFINAVDNNYIDHQNMNDYYYTVYSGNDNNKLLKDFADYLFNLKNPKIQFIQKANPRLYEYDITVNFKTVIKVIGLRDQVFKTLPTIYMNSNIKYIHPDIYRISIYKNYTNPRERIKEWKKYYEHERILEKYYPIMKKCANIMHESKVQDSILSKILKVIFDSLILKNKNIVVVGTLAYTIMVKDNLDGSSNLFIPQTKYYEFLSVDPMKDITKIKDLIKKELKGSFNESDFSYKKSGSQFNLFKDKYNVFYKRNKIAEIYDSSLECVPYNNIDSIQVGNYHLVLLYFYMGIYVSYQLEPRISELIQNKMKCLIHNLKFTRNKYLDENDYVGIEDGPMKAFHITCHGTQQLLFREQKIKRFNKEMFLQFPYKPEFSLKKKENKDKNNKKSNDKKSKTKKS